MSPQAKLQAGVRSDIFSIWSRILWSFACLLFLASGARAQEGNGDNHARAAKYPVGTSMQVHLRNKQTISGQVEKYAGDGFWIRAEGRGARKDQKIFFLDIKSINPRGGAGSQGRSSGQPRFGIDFSAGGADASIRVYRPKTPDDGGDQY